MRKLFIFVLLVAAAQWAMAETVTLQTRNMTMLEPTAMLKSDVIEKQTELISLLYDEGSATDEMRTLKREIDTDLMRLQDRHP